MVRLERAIPFIVFVLFVSLVVTIAPDLFRFQDMITGKAILNISVLIINITPNPCNTSFQSGWNLVSIPCLNATYPTSQVMFPINGSMRSLHQYVGDLAADPWKIYNPNLPAWVVQDLQLVDRKAGYWLFMNDPASYYLSGSTATPNLVFLAHGWNLVGYPTLTKRQVNPAMATITPNYEYIYLYNTSDLADHYKQYTWNSTLPSPQDLNQTVPYQGYWIYMYSPDIWVVDW